ncbi:hypothetical protein BYT27DRAFT_7128093 [Phlegmacium glaucopus]|nr:hypothetical protein BYT27DRAFT_7128093 [Phlegmacium glaucopus]
MNTTTTKPISEPLHSIPKMSFFAGASNVKIIGGEFNDIKGNLTVFDHSRHEMNLDTSNVYNNQLINSFNDTSTRIRPRNRYPSDDDDDQIQSTAPTYDDDDHVIFFGAPPRRNISSAGDHITNTYSFNIGDTNVMDAFNSRTYCKYGMGSGPFMSVDRDPNIRRNFSKLIKFTRSQTKSNAPRYSDENYESDDDDSSLHSVGMEDYSLANLSINDPTPSPTARDQHHPDIAMHLSRPPPISRVKSDPQIAMRRNLPKLMKFTNSQTESNAPRYSDESYQSDAADSSPPSVGTKDYTMANLSINDLTSSPTARDQHHTDIAMHFSRPLPFSRVKSDPQIAMQPNTPGVDYPMSSTDTSNLSPYNNRLHACSHPALAPHMKKPTMVNFLTKLAAGLQVEIYGNNDTNKPLTSVSNFRLSSIGGLSKGFSNHDASVRQTNVHSFNTETKMPRNKFNERRSLDEPVDRVDRSSSNRPERSQPGPHKGLVKIHALIAAEGALKHVADSRRTAEINAAFLDLKILESEYLVLAGFNEELIQTGFGLLEEIHIFCCVKISNPQPLLSRLGKILTPYPGIVFTPSSVHQIPVFKDDGAIWDYDDLCMGRAERHSNMILTKGISLSELVPHMSLVESQSSNSSVALSHSEGAGNGNHGGTESDKGNSRSDDHNEDREINGNSDDTSKPDPNPEDPEDIGNGDASMPCISFDVQAKLFKDTSDWVSSEPFQVLEIKGTLAVQTNPARLKPRQLSKSHVEFRRLSFQSSESAGLAYEQYHVKVEINANDENTDIDVLQPSKTPDCHHETTETTANHVITNGTLGGSLAVMPTTLLSASRSKQTSSSTAREFKKYSSKITQRDSDGIVSWGFDVDDTIERQTGIVFGGYRALPSVDFRFYGTSDYGLPPPPPEHFDVTIRSSWSLASPSRKKSHTTSGWISSIKKSKVPLYSNLYQFVKLQLPSDQLQETFYKSVTVVAVNQSSTKTVYERPALYKITPTVECSKSRPLGLESESHSPIKFSSRQH